MADPACGTYRIYAILEYLHTCQQKAVNMRLSGSAGAGATRDREKPEPTTVETLRRTYPASFCTARHAYYAKHPIMQTLISLYCTRVETRANSANLTPTTLTYPGTTDFIFSKNSVIPKTREAFILDTKMNIYLHQHYYFIEGFCRINFLPSRSESATTSLCISSKTPIAAEELC